MPARRRLGVGGSDYRPYGIISYENNITDLGDDYTFTGKEYDEENELQYFGARYLDNEVGRFISVDPATLVLHDGQRLKDITKSDLTRLLTDPQNLNSYAYAKNNPVVMVDADGNFALLFVAAVYIAPYVVPTAITAVSAVGAYFAAQEYGQGLGYMMEGQHQIAQQHFDNQSMVGAGVAGSVMSLMALDSWMNSSQSQSSKPIWTSTKDKTSVQNAYSHWNAHKSEFPELQNAKQYVEKTRDFMYNPSADTLTKVRSNGDTIMYQPDTNTFGVMDRNMVPKTLFRPNPSVHGYNNNLDYFNAQ